MGKRKTRFISYEDVPAYLIKAAKDFDTNLRLRAERSGKGDGRVYLAISVAENGPELIAAVKPRDSLLEQQPRPFFNAGGIAEAAPKALLGTGANAAASDSMLFNPQLATTNQFADQPSSPTPPPALPYPI